MLTVPAWQALEKLVASTGKDLSLTIAKDEAQEPTVSIMSSLRSVSLLYYHLFPDSLIIILAALQAGCTSDASNRPIRQNIWYYHTLTSLLNVKNACAVLPSHVIKAKALKKILVIELALRHGSSKEMAESQLLGSIVVHPTYRLMGASPDGSQL